MNDSKCIDNKYAEFTYFVTQTMIETSLFHSSLPLRMDRLVSE